MGLQLNGMLFLLVKDINMGTKYYVKISQGKVEAGYPKQLSHDPGASPNIQWESPQMLLHGYKWAIIPDSDPRREVIDYQSPKIFETYVEYETKKFAPPIILQNLKIQKQGMLTQVLRKKYQSKYSVEEFIFGVLGLYGDSYKAEILTYITPLMAKYHIKVQAIQTAISEADLNSILLEDF